jgi:predicted ATPase
MEDGELAGEARRASLDQSISIYLPAGDVLEGWSLLADGSAAEAVARFKAGLDASHAMGAVVRRSFFPGMLAEAHLRNGDPAAADACLAEALAFVEDRGEAWYAAELPRLRGETALAASADAAMAQAHFESSLAVARAQGARPWELRTATSLARLWGERGERQKARDCLNPLYGWFAEGFAMPDLVEAKNLHNALN